MNYASERRCGDGRVASVRRPPPAVPGISSGRIFVERLERTRVDYKRNKSVGGGAGARGDVTGLRGGARSCCEFGGAN